MGSSDNRALLRRFIEEIDPNADVDALPDYVHEDIELPADTMPNGRQGRAGLAEHMLWLPSVVEHRSEVQDMVGDGDRIAARIIVRGKHVGDFLGVPASGKEWAIDEIMVAHFRDGRISRIWRVADIFSLVQQLGGTPSEAVAAVSG